MQNNFITKISPIVRIFVLIILILMLLLAKSLYLILFITTLTLILFVKTDTKVNIYVKFLKRIIILLLIFFIEYIIIFRINSFISIILLLYKLLIITGLIKIYLLNVNFGDLHIGLYRLVYPFKILNVNIEKLSYDIVLLMYFYKFVCDSKAEVKRKQVLFGKKSFNIKNSIMPRIINAIQGLENFENSLKIKFYKLENKKIDFKSKIILCLFIIIFIVSIFKEVIM